MNKNSSKSHFLSQTLFLLTKLHNWFPTATTDNLKKTLFENVNETKQMQYYTSSVQ